MIGVRVVLVLTVLNLALLAADALYNVFGGLLALLW
jgi:hypothetical protein